MNGSGDLLWGHARPADPGTAADRTVREALERALALAKVLMDADGAILWLASDDELPARVIETGESEDVVEQVLALPGRQLPGAVGAPILVRGRRAGHVYLLGVDPYHALRERGTAMPLIASMVSGAIEDAHSARAAQRRLDWATAAANLGSELQADGVGRASDGILHRALALAAAKVAAIVDVSPHLGVVTAAAGPGSKALRGTRFPVADTAVQRVIARGWPVLLDGGGHGHDVMAPLTGVDSAVFVPFNGSAYAVTSVLAVGRRHEAPSYTQDDVSLLQGFGAQAGGLVGALSRPVTGPGAAGECARVAASLSDEVIRSLFSVGLELAAVVRMMPAPEARRRLEHSLGRIDATVDDVRACIVDLQRRNKAPQYLESNSQAMTVEHGPSRCRSAGEHRCTHDRSPRDQIDGRGPVVGCSRKEDDG
ncbi:MAG: hypothetical protein ACRDO2_00440 [Nocardioidaceae bacterium]